ncbi:Lrp/AsnC family transcriptional regulator [Candidatus Woesearchaeota archaeon]|nr:Lrp/AsnC family transcriptional regulator [Candidatus Woesearchaeota archaeon]
MNKKISKLLFLLSENSRITTQALSKKIRSSQQSASYLIKQLSKKKIIQNYNAIVDPIKLGFTNVFVGLNYLVFDTQTKREILGELKKIDSIISIEEGSQGADLILEYCINNLSAFNKIHSEITHKFHKSIETKFIFPVVVKHKYPKSYLINKNNIEEIILCGDRETRRLNEKEMTVLKELIKESNITYAKLSQKADSAARTIVNIKRRLEKNRIIRGYSCILNYKKLGINRQLLFLKLPSIGIKEMSKMLAYCLTHKNITELIKVIGEYQLCIVFESMGKNHLINELRSIFPIKEYLIVDIDNIVKKTYIPENI